MTETILTAVFFFNDTATTEIYTLSLHDALPICEEALFDIYRVMRPGEPPTLETAEAMFHSLFFDAERYDLSAVGRVKMNMRLDLDAEDTVRTLRREDIIAVAQIGRASCRERV